MALNNPLRLEPPFSDAVLKLEMLLTTGQPVFLIGAGCSKCVGLPLTNELGKEVAGKLKGESKVILKKIQDQFADSQEANVEDYLSEVTDWLAIADRRTERGAKKGDIILEDSTYSASQLRKASNEIKDAIARAIGNVPTPKMKIHRDFVKAVHWPSRDGRGSRLVNYLVLNYDTVIEDALALEKIRYSDGIDGGTTGWWNPLAFDREDIKARVLKLHGSIDWLELEGDPFPRRMRREIRVSNQCERRILIWPATTKYRETQLDPYAELAKRAREALTPDSRAQIVLVICGYSFGDKHINNEIDAALRKSEGKLTVVAFTDKANPEGLLADWHNDDKIRKQVMIFAEGGFYHGKIRELAGGGGKLEWWKFEHIPQLLGGRK